MIHRIRHNRYLHFFWGAMAVFLLNLSVDAPDPYPDYLPEDLTHNDQESVVEMIVEQWLGFENFFNEYDDDDGEERNSKRALELVLTPAAAALGERTAVVVARQPSTPYPPYLRWPSSPCGEVPAPPPRV